MSRKLLTIYFSLLVDKQDGKDIPENGTIGFSTISKEIFSMMDLSIMYSSSTVVKGYESLNYLDSSLIVTTDCSVFVLSIVL